MAYNQNFGGYGRGPPPSTLPPGYGTQPPPYSAAPNYGAAQNYGGLQGVSGGYMPPSNLPPGVNQELWNWFQAVDTDHNGHITAAELQRALMNGNWSPFNPETCRLMVGMFDIDGNGTIDIKEFGALWKYIQDWKSCFDRFDTDRSGKIDANELQNAFRTFGYNLSGNFTQLCIRIFDRTCCQSINFDDFIQCCVMVKTLSDQFSGKDTKQGGVITIHYEEFLRMALDNKVV